MAKVHVCNVVVLDNPSQFNNPFQFEITFECIEDLPEDLEWKIIYVGSAESEEFDQVVMVTRARYDEDVETIRHPHPRIFDQDRPVGVAEPS